MIDNRLITASALAFLVLWGFWFLPSYTIAPSFAPKVSLPPSNIEQKIADIEAKVSKAASDAIETKSATESGLDTVKRLIAEIPTKEYVELQLENTAKTAAAMREAVLTIQKSGILALNPEDVAANATSIRESSTQMTALRADVDKMKKETSEMQENSVVSSKSVAALLAVGKNQKDNAEAIASAKKDIENLRTLLEAATAGAAACQAKTAAAAQETQATMSGLLAKQSEYASKVELANLSGRLGEVSQGVESLRAVASNSGTQLGMLQTKISVFADALEKHTTAIKMLNSNQQQLSESYKSLYDSIIKILGQIQELKATSQLPG